MPNISNTDLADVLIERLNALISDPDVCKDVSRLIEQRVPCSQKTAEHPTIQVNSGARNRTVGFLGLLNGIVGVLPDGPHQGWGFIMAVIDDNGQFVRFERT